MQIYLNGEFLPIEQARISPLDRGFLFGDGVYELIPIYDNKPFLLAEHLERLERSLKAIDIKNPLTHTQWADIMQKLSQHAATPTHGIYIQITRGAGETRQHQYDATLKPTIFGMTTKIRLLSTQEKQTGLSAITTTDQRWNNCYIKSLNLLPNILAMQQAYTQNACEAILIRNNFLSEGSSSNVFVIKNDIIFTPPETPQILWGITRRFVLQLAQQHQVAYEERPISENELYDADEIWITSSGRETVPITRLNDQVVGKGLVGPLWQKMDAYFEKTRTQ